MNLESEVKRTFSEQEMKILKRNKIDVPEAEEYDSVYDLETIISFQKESIRISLRPTRKYKFMN